MNSLAEARYAVFIAYAIDNGTTTTTVMPIFGQTGGGTTTYSGTTLGSVGGVGYSGMSSGLAYTPPTYGQIGAVPVTNTVYNRALLIDIVDVPASTKDKVATVFEAKARSAGPSGNIAAVLPNMIAAAMKDFPGKNGETFTTTTVRKQ